MYVCKSYLLEVIFVYMRGLVYMLYIMPTFSSVSPSVCRHCQLVGSSFQTLLEGIPPHWTSFLLVDSSTKYDSWENHCACIYWHALQQSYRLLNDCYRHMYMWALEVHVCIHTLCTSVIYMHACTCMYTVSELLQCEFLQCMCVFSFFREVLKKLLQK